jgi:hypothetical protein
VRPTPTTQPPKHEGRVNRRAAVDQAVDRGVDRGVDRAADAACDRCDTGKADE